MRARALTRALHACRSGQVAHHHQSTTTAPDAAAAAWWSAAVHGPRDARRPSHLPGGCKDKAVAVAGNLGLIYF